jgi:hypothetical protein
MFYSLKLPPMAPLATMFLIMKLLTERLLSPNTLTIILRIYFMPLRASSLDLAPRSTALPEAKTRAVTCGFDIVMRIPGKRCGWYCTLRHCMAKYRKSNYFALGARKLAVATKLFSLGLTIPTGSLTIVGGLTTKV